MAAASAVAWFCQRERGRGLPRKWVSALGSGGLCLFGGGDAKSQDARKVARFQSCRRSVHLSNPGTDITGLGSGASVTYFMAAASASVPVGSWWCRFR